MPSSVIYYQALMCRNYSYFFEYYKSFSLLGYYLSVNKFVGSFLLQHCVRCFRKALSEVSGNLSVHYSLMYRYGNLRSEFETSNKMKIRQKKYLYFINLQSRKLCKHNYV